MVFEDDAKFESPTFADKWNELMSRVTRSIDLDKDIIYIGGMLQYHEITEPVFAPINDVLDAINGVTSVAVGQDKGFFFTAVS